MKRNSIFHFLLMFFIFSIGRCGVVEPDIKEFSFYYKSTGFAGNMFERPGGQQYNPDFSNTAVGVKLRELTGVALKFVIPQQEDPRDGAVYLTATGDYPDIIYARESIDIFKKAGALIPLGDLIDRYGPNIKKHYGKLLNYFKDSRGRLYYLGPNSLLGDGVFPGSGFWLPVDLLEENNWPVIKDFAHYIQLIRKHFKTKPFASDQSVVGFTAAFGGGRIHSLIQAPARLMGYSHNKLFYLETVGSIQWKLIVTSPFARKYYEILNQLWLEKVLDRKLFSQSYEDYIDKIATGQTLGFFDYSVNVNPALFALRLKGLTEHLYIPFPVLFPGARGDNYLTTKEISLNSGVGISVKCSDPAGVVKYWNRLLEEDAQQLIFWGIKGLHYYLSGDELVMSVGQFRSLLSPSNGIFRFVEGFPQVDHRAKFSNGNWISPFNHPDYFKSVAPSYFKNVLANYKIDSLFEWFSPPVILPLGSSSLPDYTETLEEQELIQLIETLCKDYLAKLITADPGTFSAIWDEFVRKLSTERITRGVMEFSGKYANHVE